MKFHFRVMDKESITHSLIIYSELYIQTEMQTAVFNEFLEQNSYKRFVDFIETKAFTEVTIKDEFYDKWNFVLLNNRDLQDVGFPTKINSS